MLTESPTSEIEIGTVFGETPTPQRSARRRYIGELASFLAIVAQFGLIALVVGSWQLESQQLARLMWLAFGGFIIHHLLPLRFRLQFFALLSLVALITGVGHIGPNVFTGWLGGRMTTANFLYYLLPGLPLSGSGLV